MWKCTTSMCRVRTSALLQRHSPALARAAPTQLRSLTAAALAQGRVPVESLYVTSTEFTKKTSPVLLGLAHTLEQKFTSVGYFRPIAPPPASSNTHGPSDHHIELLASELELTQPHGELVGVSADRALEFWLAGRTDDLIEEILTAFERAKATHDFMLIEGAHISPHESAMSWKLNVEFAKALNAPVLLITDCANCDASSASQDALINEIVARTAVGQDYVKAAGLAYFGTIANRVRVLETGDLQNFQHNLRNAMQARKMPFMGFLPYDEFIASKRLNEVVYQLQATHLFGATTIANNVLVSDAVVATSHLRDLFAHLKKYNDGMLVITSADRSDILLGLLASRVPGVLPTVAGILLTNGNYPHAQTAEILEGVERVDATGLSSIPIFVVPFDTFTTATAVHRVTTDILPTSVRKITQSKRLWDEFIDVKQLIGDLDDGVVVSRSPKHFAHYLLNKARSVQRHVVLTEGNDVRILQAADEILRLRLARLTILGDPQAIALQAKTLCLDLSAASIINPIDSERIDAYTTLLYNKRKHKGMTLEVARETAADATFYGTLMVESGDADGMVSGACHTTANTIRPALQLIKTDPARPLVSSVFFMGLDDGVRIYGDCAVNANPSAVELAQIAVTSAESAEAFGLLPRVALLSYATGDSNTGPSIDKVRDATLLAQQMRPDLDIYGPIQYDAAVDASIAKQKIKSGSGDGKSQRVAGHANVLVFPDLNTGNNTYKAVQQSTQCLAMGPMLQGLRKPVNDLSRGATVKDIVTTVAITAIQAEQMIQKKQQAQDAVKSG